MSRGFAYTNFRSRELDCSHRLLCFPDQDDEESFYGTPAPSEDIWKKFELLPTPPRSPHREDMEDLAYTDDCMYNGQHKSIEQCLIGVREHLLDDDEHTHTALGLGLGLSPHNAHGTGPVTVTGDHYHTHSHTNSDTQPDPSDVDCLCQGCGSKTKLIQDAMWGGKCEDSERTNPPTSMPIPADDPSRPVRPCSLPSLGVTTSQCVEPSVIFPYPLNEETTNRADRNFLTPETPSESEEDEEEVLTQKEKRMYKRAYRKRGVVTVHQTDKKGASLLNSQLSVSLDSVSKTTSPISPTKSSPTKALTKRSYSMPASPRQNTKKSRKYTLNFPPDFESAISQLKVMGHHDYYSTRLTSIIPTMPQTTSANSSDSEDCDVGKRAQHNVLERQRRNDLKDSFLYLRDQIPELHRQERAAKVVILRRGSQYIDALMKEEAKLLHQIQNEQTRKTKLKAHLESIKRTRPLY